MRALLLPMLRRRWFIVVASIALSALIALADWSSGHMSGLRLLYAMPIWMLARVCGGMVAIPFVLAASGVIVACDLAHGSMDGRAVLQDGVVWLVALSAIAAVIAHIAYVLRTEQLRATLDPLTEVLNRSEMKSTVEQAIEKARSEESEIVLALVDCDRFKEINDLYGHACGDKALCALARMLQDSSSTPKTVGRMGGDEFAVLLEGVDENAARTRMENVEQSFANHMRGLGCDSTFSFGLAVGRRGRESYQLLLEQADKDMYAQKRSTARAHSLVHSRSGRAEALESSFSEPLQGSVLDAHASSHHEQAPDRT